MDFTRETQGGNTYLVYQIQAADQLDTLSLGMIVNNKINGIAPTIYNQLDDQKFLKYNISSKVSLRQFFTGTVNRSRLLSVFSSLLDGILMAEDYMIDISTLLLQRDYIFVDVSTMEAELICVPILDRQEKTADVRSFFKDIMFCTQFDVKENGDYFAKIVGYLNSNGQFSLVDFRQLVVGLMEEIITPSQPMETKFLNKLPVEVLHAKEGKVSKPIPPIRENMPGASKAGSAPKPPAQWKNMEKMGDIPKPPALESNQGMVKKKDGFGSKPDQENMWMQPAQGEAGNMPDPVSHNMGNIPFQENMKMNQKQENTAEEAVGFAVPGTGDAFPVPGGKSKKKEKHGKEKSAKEAHKSHFSFFGKKKSGSEVEMQEAGYPIPAIGGMQDMQQNMWQQNKNPKILQNPPMMQMPDEGQVKKGQNLNQGGMGNAMGNPYPWGDFGQIGETTVLKSQAGETTVLSQGNPGAGMLPYLTRVRSREQIVIDKPLFRIGKERNYVDYFISDNPAISRSHANIMRREDGYYIEDTNSTNHTYVNEQMIMSGTAVKLEPNTRIRLGNEEFVFHV